MKKVIVLALLVSSFVSLQQAAVAATPRPTPQLEVIQQQVKKAVEQRQTQQGDAPIQKETDVESVQTEDVSDTSLNSPGKEAQSEAKEEVVGSWVNNVIVLRKINGQLYLSLF